MSVKVNLLPQATRVRARESQQRMAAIGGFAVLVALLGAGYAYQLERVSVAEFELAAATQELSLHESELSDLGPFEELEASLVRSNDALITALGPEISLAGVLQDAALVTPDDVALTSFDFVTTDAIMAADGQTIRSAVARIAISGETTTEHAPGLERLMIEYDKIGSLFNVHVVSTALDEQQPDVLLFTFEADLGEDARTGRYGNGLPEGLR